MHKINIGLNREDIVFLTLKEMKRKQEIHDFLRSEKFSKNDVRGVDFIIIAVGKSKYRKVEISVTGPRWAKKDQEKHPDIPVLAVKEEDDIESMREKILAIIYPTS
jgi:hypothetical protein